MKNTVCILNLLTLRVVVTVALGQVYHAGHVEVRAAPVGDGGLARVVRPAAETVCLVLHDQSLQHLQHRTREDHHRSQKVQMVECIIHISHKAEFHRKV